MRLSALIALTLMLVASLVAGQTAPAPAGRWEGSIQTPGPTIGIIVDLASNDKQAWIGSISIPEQGLKGFVLSDIVVSGNAVKFAMKGVAGDPAFDGKISADGKALSGDFTQGGTPMTFGMKRTGEARFEEPAKSTPVTKNFEGAWEGVLEAMGQRLRVVIKLANKDGVGSGTFASIDQGGSELPLTSVVQKDAHIAVEVSGIGYAGDIDAAGTEIKGTFTQGPASLPLVMKKKQ